MRAVAQLDWLMAPLEERLRGCQDSARVDASFVSASAKDRLPSQDESTVAVRALAEIGVLSDGETGSYRLSRAQLVRTEGYRQGVRDGIEHARHSVGNHTFTLLGSVPLGVPATAEREIRSNVADLRAGIMEIVSSARKRIVLASPFWDLSTAEELSVLLARRLEAGVAVDILGRFVDGDDALKVLIAGLSGYGGTRIFSWHAINPEDPLGSQTFHFKAAVSDGGDLAYVGSANFTISGLRSRMELGILLREEPALRVARVLDMALNFARLMSVLEDPNA